MKEQHPKHTKITKQENQGWATTHNLKNNNHDGVKLHHLIHAQRKAQSVNKTIYSFTRVINNSKGHESTGSQEWEWSQKQWLTIVAMMMRALVNNNGNGHKRNGDEEGTG